MYFTGTLRENILIKPSFSSILYLLHFIFIPYDAIQRNQSPTDAVSSAKIVRFQLSFL